MRNNENKKAVFPGQLFYILLIYFFFSLITA
jgi:hypothetical protein